MKRKDVDVEEKIHGGVWYPLLSYVGSKRGVEDQPSGFLGFRTACLISNTISKSILRGKWQISIILVQCSVAVSLL